MRIVCQSCGTAYAIDDRSVGPRGVRAKCPRCQHLQAVRPAGAEAGPGGLTPPPGGLTPPPGGLTPPPGGLTPPPPGGRTPLGVLHPAPSGGRGLPPDGRTPLPSLPPLPPLSPAPPAAGGLTPLPGPPGPPGPPGADWAMEGDPTQPLARLPVRPPPGAPRGVPEAAAVDPDTAPLELATRPRAAAPAAPPPPPEPPPAAPRSAERAPGAGRGGGGRGWGLALGAVVLAGLGVAGALALRARRARTEEAPPLAVLAPLAPELRAAVERWRKSAADLTGSASDQAEAGRRLLAEDTRQGALRAEERFQNALVLDPRRDDALAGYLQALALGRGAAVPEPVFREALALSEAGLQRSGRAPALLVATAQLLLSRGRSGEGLEQARALATEALQAGPPPLQAEAHLVLARVLLTSSRALARGHLEQAEALAPGLGRAVPLKAELLQAEGRYREAVDLLRERVRRDPEHWAALGELAGLLEGVGEVQAAREVYAAGAAARRPEAARALGVLLLRGEGARPREAVRVLRELLARRETLGAGEAPGVLVDLATAERAAGNAAGAQRAAEEALALAPALPGAHLQLLLLELSRGRAGAARPHLAAVEGKLQDAGLEALLAGRVALLGGDAAAAVQHFLRAVEADPRRTDAQLWAGVAAARAGRPADAFRLLRAALQQDPARAPASGVRPVPQVGGGVVAGELLAGADGHLLRLAEGEDVVPARLYEGLVRYHQRAGGAAERLLEQVVRQDVRNAPAFALRALLAAERGDRRAALRLGAVAAGEGRELALARAANAEALAEAGRTEDARQEMAAAHAAAPAVATYAVRLAELEAATGAKDAARERLLKVVARDPANAAAPRALYQLDR